MTILPCVGCGKPVAAYNRSSAACRTCLLANAVAMARVAAERPRHDDDINPADIPF